MLFYAPGGYQDLLEDRMMRLGIPWTGDLGVRSTHHYQGIFIVATAPNVFGPGDGYHDLFIRDALAADHSLWSISSWHENMRAMQVGGKSDATGWGVYEASRRGGAIIATAHEHSYSRTHLLSDIESQTIASSSDLLSLAANDPTTPEDEGRSFVFQGDPRVARFYSWIHDTRLVLLYPDVVQRPSGALSATKNDQRSDWA